MVAQAERLGDDPAGLGVVAREQDDVAHVTRAQALHRFGRVTAQLVLQHEQRGQASVDGDEQRRGAHGVCGHLVTERRTQRHLVALHQAAAADEHTHAFHVDVHAESDPLGSRGGLGKVEPSFRGEARDGAGHRVAERAFGRCHQAQHGVLRERTIAGDAGDARRAEGERAGLVEHYRVDAGEILEHARALDEDVVAPGLADRRHDRGGNADASGEAVIRHQDRRAGVEAARQAGAQRR